MTKQKCSVSGEQWDKSHFEKCITEAREQLRTCTKILERLRPEITEPTWHHQLCVASCHCSHGRLFSEKSHQTGLSPLKHLRNESRHLHKDVSLAESPTELQGPRFNETGF